MGIVFLIQDAASQELAKLTGTEIKPGEIQVTETKPEFEGDYTILLFGFAKQARKSPDAVGKELGDLMIANHPGIVSKYNVIKGFLNLTVSDEHCLQFLSLNFSKEEYGTQPENGKKVMVEYSSPNTNKPLHLGHLRNNFLGWSISEIFRASGYDVKKTAIANDRGIHICKSMVAWKKFGNGATPESTHIKGDHLVGDYYVKFGEEHKKQVQELLEKGLTKEEAEKEAPIMKEAQQMLVDWEAEKPEVIHLWKKMNEWVYSGFEETYRRIGSDFDKTYYESSVYLLGKQMIEEGLRKNVFYKKEDGSVWIDLTADGLDEKIVQRKDGTAVYITQDIGLVELKQKEFGSELSIYVVGNEQDYHFKVLKLIAQKLGIEGADGIHHLSYGMVELPTGRMKTREGTVVDADDIVDEMEAISERHTRELGKVNDFTDEELKQLYATIGLGALKFYLLRVDPKKRMIFNPEESIDFHGFTGPFIQYTYARTKSILRKEKPSFGNRGDSLLPVEKKLIIDVEKYPAVIAEAAGEMNPSVIANYIFRLAQSFNSFLTEQRVLTAETQEKKELRLQLSQFVANVIRSSMGLLGIGVPERM
ncbi:MAG: arginine--tRNA ligase [Chitinophagaceae bacterium]|nr:arginine--tRNA ligase [Chitinophagaceae bacterium]